ncbi:hypothetical protein DI458_04175 [Burkholderia contaminans]|nr:hypothetical protein [Burkholderia contaminans]MBA9835688.1 hypothetical protein [Burkholderia contaminans]MBA9861235.1 hypothetical protein [Burkholderia contaminans]MBA9904668.1 hypothetical protein [Burkholderia contaminans]MBA9927758.1 hypothetical protein [Burkholderia contaminans]
MPPARPTDTQRSERAPAYGTRTLYLLDTNHGTARHATRNARRRLRIPEDKRTRPRAANTHRRQRRF